MSSNDPLIGRQLANFRLERIIGRGGMAVVYYGMDVKLQRPVAVKIIDVRYRGDPAYAQRFVDEARLVAQWRHDNILQVYYADDEDGMYYFAMEYIEGQDLAKLMAAYAAEGELMPPGDVLRIGHAIASALDYAHRRGVIHRDVKPSNVLVSKDGRVVLGDFGLALDVERGSRGEVFGTAHYIAPEQACRSADAVPQSDLYSFGVILFEMLTGVTPFDDDSPTSVALQQLTQPPPSPRSINPNLNDATEEVLLKALSKAPADRYQTGVALMAALERALKAGPPPAAPPAPLPPAPAGLTAARPISRLSVAERVALGLPRQKPPARKRSCMFWMMGLLLILAVALPGLYLLFPGQLGSLASFIFTPTVAPATPAAWLPPSRTPTFTLMPTNTAPPSASSTPTAESSLTPTDTPLPPTATLTFTPSMTPTATLTPTHTFTPVPSATHTLIPTATASDTPTATFTASPTPTLTHTPTASTTPTSTATATATPTLAVPTRTPTATLSPTPLTSGRKFVLYYNYNSFYMLNASRSESEVMPLAFERLGLNDEVLNRFDGWEWAKYELKILPNTCMRVELLNSSPYLRPKACSNLYRSSRYPARSAGFIFWTYTANSRYFRVLWNEQEMKRCLISAGVCEFFLP